MPWRQRRHAGAAPSPLLVVYQAEWGFPGWLLTLAFAIYTIVLLITLLRDPVSRRPGALRSLKPRAAVPAAAPREFAAAVPVLIDAWALAGFYLGLSAEVLQNISAMPSAESGSEPDSRPPWRSLSRTPAFTSAARSSPPSTSSAT